jgi:hypothetical protein
LCRVGMCMRSLFADACETPYGFACMASHAVRITRCAHAYTHHVYMRSRISMFLRLMHAVSHGRAEGSKQHAREMHADMHAHMHAQAFRCTRTCTRTRMRTGALVGAFEGGERSHRPYTHIYIYASCMRTAGTRGSTIGDDNDCALDLRCAHLAPRTAVCVAYAS